MVNPTEYFARLHQIEEQSRGNPAILAQLEQTYEQLARSHACFLQAISERNQFRIRHAAALRVRRPRVLYSCRSRRLQVHAAPLLHTADVVFVSLVADDRRFSDAVYYDPCTGDATKLLASLPKGFKPDLYFDFQTCTRPVLLRGVESMPFPTVAALCHQFKVLRCELIAEQFDFVLPVSRKFSELLARWVPPEKIIDMPFGMNWGSFHHVFSAKPEEPREFDVLFAHGGSTCGSVYGPYRTFLAELFESAKAKLGDRYNFHSISNVSYEEFHKALCKSRIVLNAVGINGPYNYRTCETINAGAVLMQYDAAFATGPQGMEDYLKPGDEFVPFDRTDFLPKLERLLTDPESCIAIARRAQERVTTEYSYKRLYTELFAKVAAQKGWRERRPARKRAAWARVCEYIQAPDAKCVLAMLDIGAARGAHPAALLMPLYRSLRESISPESIRAIVGPVPKTSDAAAECLAVYDAAIKAIPAPSMVDRFNHLVVCAQEGRIRPAECREYLKALELMPRPQDDEIARIVRPQLRGFDESLSDLAYYAVLNLGCLLAEDRPSRGQAAIDFMTVWAVWLLERAGAATPSECEEAGRILASYNICGNDVQPGTAADPPSSEERAAA